MITKSLDIAIRHLRHESESIVVWIDQICINQSDSAEKSTQVQLMSLIYQRAFNTVIWLGDTAGDEAFNALQTIEARTHDNYGLLTAKDKERLFDPLYFEAGPAGAFEAIEVLFASSWFQRTWTIQEAVLSYDPWVMSGTSIRHWENSIGCCPGLRDLGLFQPRILPRQLDMTMSAATDVQPMSVHGSQAALTIWRMKMDNSSRYDGMMSLLDALIETRHTQATNPLDNVYGVLGICEHDIVPDYTIQATELFRRVTLQILRLAIQDFDYMLSRSANGTALASMKPFILLYCIDHAASDTDLPSWVVDWSKPPVTTRLASGTSVFNCFDAGKYPVTASPLQISDDESMLYLKGKVFDTIDHLSSIIQEADLEASASSGNTGLRMCVAYVTSPPPNLTTDLSFLGFCKLLTAGKDITGRQKYPDTYTEIFSFLCDTVTGQCPTFADQIYTPRQQKGRLTLDSLKTRNCGRTFLDLREAYKSAVLNRRLCWTKKGRLGLVPRFARPGDCVVVVPGAPVPFVIRPVGKGEVVSAHHFIGESFVDGIMHGEAMADSEIGVIDICLV
jgi:hypothetical protein